MPRLVSAGVSLLLWAAAAGAADPPRIEQLSNPQSQTIGKKRCGGAPAVYVPMFDPCPGEPAPAPAAVSGPPLPAARSPSRPMLPPFEAVTPMQRDALALFQRGMEARARRDWGLAFKSFHEACLGSNYKRGCGAAVDIWDTHRDDAKRALPNPVSPAFLSIDGCGAGDVLACFTLCAGSVERTAGERPVDAAMVRRQCMDRIQPAEVEAVASYSRARRAEALLARSGPGPAAQPPAQAPVRALPLAPPPVVVTAPPAPPRSVADDIAEFKRTGSRFAFLLEGALRREPDNAEANFLLGEHFMRTYTQADKSVGFLERAARLQPDNAQYWRTLGTAHLERRQWDGAVRALHKAVDLRNDDAAAWGQLIDAYSGDQRHAEARSLLDEAVQRQPARAFLWALQGGLALRMKDPPRALAAYQKVLALEPMNAAAGLAAGRLHCDARRSKEALASFEGVLDQQPNDYKALNGYNQCRVQLGLAAIAAYQPRTSGKLRP